MITNMWIFAFPTPSIIDAVSGRQFVMIRWVEWVTLSFVMTFVVEAIDSTSLRGPALCAASQFLSTFCGMLMPLAASLFWWKVIFCTSCLLFGYLFRRLWLKEALLRERRRTLPAGCLELRLAELSQTLFRQCVGIWMVFPLTFIFNLCLHNLVHAPQAHALLGAGLNWSGLGRRAKAAPSPSGEIGTDYAMIIDCVVDMVSKLLYASAIEEAADAEPVLVSQDRFDRVDERMRIVWKDASDVILLSHRVGGGSHTVAAVASPSVSSLLDIEGDAQSRASESWQAGVQLNLHPFTAEDELVACSLEMLVAQAWQLDRFLCHMTAPATPGARPHDSPPTPSPHFFEVRSSSSEFGRVIICRDVTARVFKEKLEREVEDLMRLKDEEANDFTRHEVKNGVLAGLAQCDRLAMVHEQAVPTEWPSYDAEFCAVLSGMRKCLDQTLQGVLSHTLSIDISHGCYAPVTSPVDLLEVLSACMAPLGNLPITCTPRELPLVSLDARLLLHIYRNAMSNAIKYGSADAPVETELVHADGTLTVRVVNLPGAEHATLLALPDPNVVFNKRVQLHSAALEGASRLGSKGDGAWVMRQCCKAMGGSCRMIFEPARTVFTFSVPAPVSAPSLPYDTYQLNPDTVWVLGVDDCEFQRYLLGLFFTHTLAIRPDHVHMVGETSKQLQELSDIIVERMESLPPDALLVAIVDENLAGALPGLSGHGVVSGSHAVHDARRRLAPRTEARLLALIRSANDSAREREFYLAHAHGTVSKGSQGRLLRSILDAAVHRFGRGCLASTADDAAEEGPTPDPQLKVAARELQKTVATVDGWPELPWAEVSKDLHRMKGIIMSVQTQDCETDAPLLDALGVLHRCPQRPAGFGQQWLTLKEQVVRFTTDTLS